MDFAAMRRVMIRGAREVNPTDPKAALNAIIKARFQGEFTSGKALLASSGNGFSSQWATFADVDPSKVATVAESALTWLEEQSAADVINPTKLPRQIKRLQVSFSRACV